MITNTCFVFVGLFFFYAEEIGESLCFARMINVFHKPYCLKIIIASLIVDG